MQTKPIELTNKNRLMDHYRIEDKEMMNYFDYKPFDDFQRRLKDMQHRSYNRDQLVQTLHNMNENWAAPSTSLQQIERLRDENSVVVIGGQQAGLLTGPLYSINKLISIVRLAKEQEKKLQRPVIPVFWIAGEDHDFEEINHIYTEKHHHIHKHRLKSEMNNKTSVSHLKLDQEEAAIWLQTAFSYMKETIHTKSIYEKVQTCLRASYSYVDFFARLIFELFPDEGIVLVDSGDTAIRQLEIDFFELLINKQEDIATSVYETVQKLQQGGYTIPLEVEFDDAHLFYHDEYNERILLKREDELWIGKNDEVTLTTTELVTIAKQHPERLSNNVVTRPLVQEFLFPTLAFVGGDGEISYWASLKQAFHQVGFKMPPVVPRISFTYQTARISKLLQQRVLDPAYVIENGLDTIRMNWLLNQETPSIEQLFHETYAKIDQMHTPLHDIAKQISPDLEAEAKRNQDYIKGNIAYLQRKMEQKLAEKYEFQLEQFDEITNALKPNATLQERIWSPLPFMNEYGMQFFRRLMHDDELSMKQKHYLVTL